MNEEERVDLRKVLRQIAWRLQYRERKRRKKECIVVPHDNRFSHNPFITILDHMLVRESLQALPSTRERYILYRLYVDDRTESEVALELRISQQAVSKWKWKSLRHLAQTMKSESSWNE